MSNIIQTIDTFFESQSGMFWLIVALFVIVVYVGIIRAIDGGKIDKLTESLSTERMLSSGFREQGMLFIERNQKLARDNAKLSKIAGDAMKDADDLRYRNTRLYGANEMLADMVTDKLELISAVGMAADRACSTCPTKACTGCEIRAMRSVYIEPQTAEDAPEQTAKNPAEGLPHRSCAWCEHAEHCREDGGLEYNMPPTLTDKQDVDCINFSFDEKTAPPDEESEEPSVCGTSCPTCSKNETCDKEAGSGYQPDGRDGCANWENWQHVEDYGMVEVETP